MKINKGITKNLVNMINIVIDKNSKISKKIYERKVGQMTHKIYATIVLIAIVSIVAIPPMFTLFSITKYGVNVPYWDEWQLVPLLEKSFEGKLTFSDLFSQHNEHRLLFPYVCMLTIAKITKYNVVDEMYFSWILSIITFLFIYKIHEKDLKSSIFHLVMFIPVSFLFFTPMQFENIFMGWQIQYYLAVLGVVTSIYFLSYADKVAGFNFLMAMICATVASFSVINGLLIWIIGFLIILVKDANKKPLLLAWIIAGVGTNLIYFYGWSKPSYHPKIGFDIVYFFVSIGSPLSWGKTSSLYIGAILLFIYMIVIVFLVKYRRTKDNVIWICLIAFSVLTSVMLTLGRSGFGVDQALSSRYIIYTLLGIIGVYAILINTIKKDKKYKYVCVVIMALLMIGMFFNYARGIDIEASLHNDRIITADNLYNYRNVSDDRLKLHMFSVAKTIREGAHILEYRKLSVFSDSR